MLIKSTLELSIPPDTDIRIVATPEQVETLLVKHGVYMIGDSRMNIAGLNEATIPVLAKAIIEVGI